MPAVLGVDSSTDATRVEVRDLDTGAVLATGRSPHPPAPGASAEQRPAVWWQALIDAVAQTGRIDVAAMAVSAQPQALVVLDDAGAVLRPALLGHDRSATSNAETMVRRAGSGRWAAAVGSVPTAAFGVAKVAWLAEAEPSVAGRIGRLLQAQDWLTLRLSGRAVTDRGGASATGYWSPAEGQWRPDLLALVAPVFNTGDWRARLPDVLGPSRPADWMAASVHPTFGLRGRPLVGSGTGQSMAAALGIGQRPRQATVTIDVTGQVSVISRGPSGDASGAVWGLADATGHYLPTVPTLNGAGVTATVARALGVSFDELGALALDGRPGARGVTMLPFLEPEHTSLQPEDTSEPGRGAIVGMSTTTGRVELARAAFEGVVCNLLDGLDSLVDAGVDVDLDSGIRLAGLGARSEAFRQIVADLSGHPVHVPAGSDHVAAGACVQAAATLAEESPSTVASAWNLGYGRVTEPREIDREAVRAQFRRARLGS